MYFSPVLKDLLATVGKQIFSLPKQTKIVLFSANGRATIAYFTFPKLYNGRYRAIVSLLILCLYDCRRCGELDQIQKNTIFPTEAPTRVCMTRTRRSNNSATSASALR